MSRFFVGQWVRLVRADAHQELVGNEYRITGLEVKAWGMGLGHYTGCALDGKTPYGVGIVAPPSFLEPIIPEGMQPAKWEDCMWQPEGVAA